MSRDLKIFLMVLILVLIVGGSAAAVYFLLNSSTDKVLARADEKYKFGDVTDIKAGIELYSGVISDKQTPRDAVVKAMASSAEGYVLLWQRTKDYSKLDIAQSKYKELINTYPDSPEARKAYLQIARINFLQGNYDTALTELDNVLTKSTDPYITTEAYNQKADIYSAIGDNEKAVYYFSRKENMNSDYATLGRAKAFIKMGETGKALGVYEDFLKYNPASPLIKDVEKAWLDTAYNYAFNLYNARDYRMAIQYFDRITVLFPANPKAENALYWIGEAYYDRKDFANAVESFEKVLDNRSSAAKDPDALLKLGMISFEQGDYPLALKYFENLLDNYSDSRLVAKAESWKEQTIREIRYQ